jgi:hypothetical protein
MPIFVATTSAIMLNVAAPKEQPQKNLKFCTENFFFLKKKTLKICFFLKTFFVRGTDMEEKKLDWSPREAN